VNKSLGNMLRSLVSEHNSQWDQIFPQVEFTYNDPPNRSTGKSPFQIIYGMHPRRIFVLRYLGRGEFRSAGVEDFSIEMHNFHDQNKGQLHDKIQRYKNRIDHKRREVNFEIGDQVLVHLRKEIFLKGKYNKLKMKKIGPCKILKKISTNAYEIELLEDTGISPIVNVTDLYPYRMDDREGTGGQEEIHWKRQMLIAEKPQIESILDKRIAKKTGRKVYYECLVKWKDYPTEYASRVTKTDIHQHGERVEELIDRIP
jgi:hypothetical protein